MLEDRLPPYAPKHQVKNSRTLSTLRMPIYTRDADKNLPAGKRWQDIVRQQLFRLLMHSARVVICAGDYNAQAQ